MAKTYGTLPSSILRAGGELTTFEQQLFDSFILIKGIEEENREAKKQQSKARRR